MNKKKKWIIVSIVVAFIGLLFLSKQPQVATESNELEAGQYKSGEDFEPGIYDVVSNSDSMVYGGKTLDEGEVYSGVYLPQNHVISIEGEGTVQLVPAEQESVEPNENGELVFDSNGNYEVGTQIEPGTYEVTANVEGGVELEDDESPWVQVINGYGTENEIINSYQYTDESDENIIKLERGQVLQVYFQETPNTEVELVLTKVE